MWTMIETVARTLRQLTIDNGGVDRGSGDEGWRDYVPDARRMLEAMAQPSAAMNDAAFEKGNELFHVGGDAVEPIMVWGTMIEAALQEDPPK